MSEELVNEIVSRANHLNSKEFENFQNNLYNNGIRVDLEEEAKSHNVRIESDKDYDGFKPSDEYKRAIEGLKNAEDWVNQNPSLGLEDKIKGIAGRVNESNQAQNYRRVTQGVTIMGSVANPPYPAKIPKEMEKFTEEIKALKEYIKKGEATSIDEALYSHFQLARIHPFEDGNGRTARGYQNHLLQQNGFPPALMLRSDRPQYLQKMQKAVLAYKEREGSSKTFRNGYSISNEERDFFNFVGKAINASLDLVFDGAMNFEVKK